MIVNKNTTGRTDVGILPSKYNESNISHIFGNNISSVGNSGAESAYPISTDFCEKTINLSGDSKELHLNNRDLQANQIHSLLAKYKMNVNFDDIIKTMNLGHGGNVLGQGLTYGPENTLIMLTLLKSDEITSSILSSAAQLIKHAGSNDNDKKIIKSIQEFDAKLNKIISKLGADSIEVLSQRFGEKYVDPEIKNKLTPYLAEGEINEHSINELLVDDLCSQNKSLMTEAKNQLETHSKNNYVDRAQQISNIFSALEQKIEMIKSLTIFTGTASQPETLEPAMTDKCVLPEDTVDGGNASPPVAPKATPSTLTQPIIINNTTINHYNMATTSHSETKESQVESNNQGDHTPDIIQESHVEREVDNIAQPGPRFRTSLEISNVNRYQPASVKGNEQKEDVLVTQELHQNTLNSARMSSGEPEDTPPLSFESKQTMGVNAFLPKANMVTGRFKSVEVVDEATGKTKKSWQPIAAEARPVTLTTEGALTRNQAEKDSYANGPIASGTEKMGIPNNTNTFGNRFKSAEVTDEATGKTKKSWQLVDKKTSKPVTLTERGALTRDQSKKDAYTTQE